MPQPETTLAFFGLSLLLGLTSGPDNLFVLMQTLASGRRAGLAVVLGLCNGLCVHTAAVALGLAAIFAASASAFVALKFVGASYLAYLAWQAWRAPGAANGPDGVVDVPAARLYRRGIVMNLTNPKIVLFFLAFLPQFVDPRLGIPALQVSWFGCVFIVATLIAFGSIVFLAAFLGGRLARSRRVQRILNRVAAVVFLGLALRLAVAER
jgi:threonine/homoserine/homoserine lactone efflux protein